MGSMLPLIVPLIIVGVVFWFAVLPFFRMRAKIKHLTEVGVPEVATVVEISQTGTTLNQVPQMRVVLDIQQAGEAPRRVTTKQLIDLGSMPRAGDLVYVVVDPKDPNSLQIAGAPKTQLHQPPPQPVMTDQQTLDTIGLSPRLREHGKLAVATVLAVNPGQGSATRFEIEIDAIGAPKRRVTVDQVMYGDSYSAGERVYCLVDPDDPNIVALMPLSLIGGQRLPQGANRLDAVVRGPEILRSGATAQGTVQEATQIPMHNPVLEARGFSRWHLKVHIVPDNGDPAYDAEQDITYTTQEKASRLAKVGAVVPIRYDSNDPQCFVTNSIALGYPDPYADAVKAMQDTLKQSS